MTKIERDSMKDKVPFGVYDISYYEGRRKNRALKYRVRRRTDEVASALIKYSPKKGLAVLDLGTADGLMLEYLQGLLPDLLIAAGIDYSFELLATNRNPAIIKVQADALTIPVRNAKFDAVIATAVIEHVKDASRFINEIFRVLTPGGILILTTPNPILAHLSEKIGLLKEPGHYKEFTLAGLNILLTQKNFTILDSYKFMFSPVGFPAEKTIEKFLRIFGLSFIMANQCVVCQKSNNLIPSGRE